jgi:hypothetical protein
MKHTSILSIVVSGRYHNGIYMSNPNLSEAFAQYGAKLANPQWAVSAKAEDGSVVMSCWAHFFKPGDGGLRYEDTLSRWSGNAPGNNLCGQHVADAFNNKLPVRLVIATAVDTEVVDSGNDASKVKKTFHTRPDMIGRITHFDGDRFIIDFQRNMA